MKKEYVKPQSQVVELKDKLMDGGVVINPGSPTGEIVESKRGFFDESAEDEDNTAETGSLWDEPMWQ